MEWQKKQLMEKREAVDGEGKESRRHRGMSGWMRGERGVCGGRKEMR